MSKQINVNPDHYKTAGRERQGEDVLVEREKQEYTTKRDRNQRDKQKRRKKSRG